MVSIRRLETRLCDESGMSYVFVGLGMMAFLSASMLAIDVGMLMTARNQAQNSADAGALAGATALAFDDYDDRTATGPAVTSAIDTAKANNVMAGTVTVQPSDVEFLTSPAGLDNRVRVTVYRVASNDPTRHNPLSTLIARYFGMPEAGVGATATAEASPANAMTCVKPFTIPDRWIEKQTPPWDPDDTFDLLDNNGNPLANPDVYIGPKDKDTYTGYDAERDKGMRVVLKADNDSKVAPSFYYPWDMPKNDDGASDYRWNIANCNTSIMTFGQEFPPKPGNMVGPTKEGIDELIAKDPDAEWDVAKKKVINNAYEWSPRVVAIPLFDPVFYEEGKHTGRKASLKFVNYLGFFVEEMRGNEVVGRITPIGGLLQGNGGPAPEAAFPTAIRLVK
jgi:Flp pilus assembly protein TadG